MAEMRNSSDVLEPPAVESSHKGASIFDGGSTAGLITTQWTIIIEGWKKKGIQSEEKGKEEVGTGDGRAGRVCAHRSGPRPIPSRFRRRWTPWNTDRLANNDRCVRPARPELWTCCRCRWGSTDVECCHGYRRPSTTSTPVLCRTPTAHIQKFRLQNTIGERLLDFCGDLIFDQDFFPSNPPTPTPPPASRSLWVRMLPLWFVLLRGDSFDNDNLRHTVGR